MRIIRTGNVRHAHRHGRGPIGSSVGRPGHLFIIVGDGDDAIFFLVGSRTPWYRHGDGVDGVMILGKPSDCFDDRPDTRVHYDGDGESTCP